MALNVTGMVMAVLVVCFLSVLLPGCDSSTRREEETLRALGAIPSEPAKKGQAPEGVSEGHRDGIPKDLWNPLPFDQQTVDRGRESYALHCSRCHGIDAETDLAAVQSLDAKPPDLIGLRVQSKTDGMLFAKIDTGSLDHPPTADSLTADDRWAIVRYLRYRSDPSKGWRA